VSRPLYWPFYCEENVWHLCGEPWAHDALVAWVSNPARAVTCHFQRAAADGQGPIVWDYHVILLVPGPDGWQVVDLDTTLGDRVPFSTYLERTFLAHEPRFVVLPAAEYRSGLRSDRRHMRRPDGTHAAPPPPWPGIGEGSNVLELVAAAAAGLDLAALRTFLDSRR
jgi:hypothetical protein